MPHRPYWFREIPSKLRWLEAIADPVMDRRGIESVFNVGQTEAQRIMKRVGATKSGSGLIVQRWRVIEWLRKLQRTGAVEDETARVVRLENSLEGSREATMARKVPIAAGRVDQMSKLAAGIHLKPGELRIEFYGIEDLLRHLYELSQAIAADYQAFETAVEE